MVDSGIKNILFDLGGVIISTNRDKCIQAFEELGVKDAIQLFESELFQQKYHEFESGFIAAPDFRTFLRSADTALSKVTDEELDAAWNSMLGEIPASTFTLLEQLKERYKLYLLSNTNSIHWEWIRNYIFANCSASMTHYFEQVYLSFRLSECKPSTEVYESVLESAHIKASETLFIDDKKENTDAAQELGFPVYNPKSVHDWSFLFETE